MNFEVGDIVCAFWTEGITVKRVGVITELGISNGCWLRWLDNPAIEYFCRYWRLKKL